jgi:hypothetical protein
LLQRFAKRLSYANVMATIALFIAIGGGAYAAGLAKDSVKSKHIKDGEVKSQDLADAAVTEVKLTPADGMHFVAPAPANGDQACLATPQTGIFCGRNLGAGGTYYRNYGGGYEAVSYFKDRSGVVHLQGLFKSITGVSEPESSVFFLPPGYRPAETLLFSTDSNETHARIDIQPDGGVIVVDGQSNNYITLSGISFRPS